VRGAMALFSRFARRSSILEWPRCGHVAAMNRYSAEELNKIFVEIAPQRGLVLPLPAGPAPRGRAPGPAVGVYLRHSEILPGTGKLEDRYWKILRQTPVTSGVGVLALINILLSEHRSLDRDVHRILTERFVTPTIAAKVAEQNVAGGGFSGAFTRTGCLQLMRHLLVYGNRSVQPAGRSEKELGELALLTNEFIQRDQVVDPGRLPNLDLLLSFVPVWDIHNPRDLAYALSRMFTILTEILPGNDPEVRRLAAKAGLNISGITVESLPLNDFIAAVFGLFAYGRNIKSPAFSIVDMRRIFSQVGFPTAILRKLVKDRALTAAAFRKRLSGGKPRTRKAFGEELERHSFLTESLNDFRHYPFMKLDANRVLILDLEFLTELLTAGVYWNIFDSLPRHRRESFKELWGRLFEIYGVDLLKEFYPHASGMLAADVNYDGGQVDALLDFGEAVIVFEIKSSLLREDAKRSGDGSKFVADFERKFVRNQKGKPKALLQLAASCKAIEDARIPTAMRPGRIYPVCVSDEPAVESFFFTAYANETFEKELPAGSRIRPVTMMSVNELEEILPYVSENLFSWSELLDFRLSGPTRGAFSVHQSIYDLLREKGLSARRNQAIRKSFDEVWKIIRSRYTPPAAQ
jgi:hypothetical protein